jgi:predicted molibdopterin-dependent oxidoreductase YjgC
VKDAVVKNNARLVVVTSHYSEVCDFIAPPPSGSIMPSPQRVHSAALTGEWLRPHAGGELATLVALQNALSGKGDTSAPGVDAGALQNAANILKDAGDGELAVIFAPSPASPALAREGAKAAANVAVLLKGEAAATALHVLPATGNANGIADMGATPGNGGKTVSEMVAGGMKALVIVGDNPVMHLPNQDATTAALQALDALIVIDSLPTDTAKLATVAFADLPAYGKEGTFTTADHRIVELTRGETATGDQRDALEILNALGDALATKLGKSYLSPGADAASIMRDAAASISGYENAGPGNRESGRTRTVSGDSIPAGKLQDVNAPAVPTPNGQLVLTSNRTLYTSLDGASIHSEEADKLHREEFLEINPADAANLRIQQNRPVYVSNGTTEVLLSAALTDAVAAGSVFLPFYYDGGIVNRLLTGDNGTIPTVTVRPA